ncbi:MAG: 1-deoxy-D-xylulose-5-phosphate synthase [Candidatus Hydrogenedentes bacterium]|nr:1-deoxy-D-xylulose-5-phosphate synthase [Candidatus Hydrogenedentota bacterium]
MKSRIVYIELKSGDGHNDRGPARIGRVTFSKTGKTLRYHDLELQRLNRGCANFVEINSGDEYWVSGPKKNGEDRHWAGGGPVEIDDDVREEYWSQIRNLPDRVKDIVS